ncbi:Putative two-component response regulator; putative membrane protein [Leptospira biflexa serovar Patoc strain 'Patoc 1 (Paris)']|uniref:Sensory/regulatory protein RpfC n=1 Tax=Leptospira biflexa serovar Patoc (strain Patoc 1 / ATCC 23582 / Paris) TaxID=456481 RepID=B0SN05_LEPBP|nr:response regulator [Leptospira biflexa]ABZ97192.1 Putative two-component response regulator; putative membrane protein [Leptospira biflexa serovar Patoc strain 'Patoc 1 (Paris)']
MSSNLAKLVKQIILNILFSFLIFSFFGCIQKPNPPMAKFGILDSRDWNFDLYGNVPLNGEWEIHWKQWEPKEEQKPSYTKIPGNWTDSLGNKLPNGYATLRLKILVKENTKSFYLQNGVTRNAFRIQVGNETVYESGKIGFDSESEISNINIQTVSLPQVEKGFIDLRIQVSCFHYHVCGVATPYLLGTHDGINKSFFEATSRDILVFSSLGTLAFFHFVLFLFWRDEKTHLYFSFVCLLASIRILSIGETRLIYNYIPMGMYEFMVRVNGISFTLLYLSFVRYVKEVYPDKKYQYFYQMNYIAAVILIFGIPFPTQIYSKIQSYHLILSLLGLFTLLYPIIHGVMVKKPGARFFLFSLVSTMLLFSLDILTEFAKKGTAYLGQYGFLVFGLSQALFIADRMIQNFKNKEKLKQEKELALAEVRFKSAFLSTMSHEIRTPMNGILGMTQMFGQTSLTDEQKEYLSLIQFSGENLLLLVNDILDLTKLEAGKFELRLETIVLSKFLNDMVQLFRSKINTQYVNLELVTNTDLPKHIITDQRRFNQIISNLLGNAIKFTETGTISLIVWSDPIDSKKCKLNLQIKDTGIGIPNEKLNDLFQPFLQIHSHLSGKTNGTGLGLTITKKIVEEMSGKISVLSELGKGSVFHVEIPVSVSNEEIPTSDSLPNQSFLKSDNWEKNLAEKYPAKILIADDDSINLKVSKMFLKKLGYVALIAENGEKTLEVVEKENPDLILLDVQMPDIDGIQVTKQIRKNKNLKRQPIIIALTANVMEEEKENCLSSGMDDFMTKPLLMQDLVYMIKKWSKGFD